jgi:hypothetical protein
MLKAGPMFCVNIGWGGMNWHDSTSLRFPTDEGARHGVLDLTVRGRPAALVELSSGESQCRVRFRNSAQERVSAGEAQLRRQAGGCGGGDFGGAVALRGLDGRGAIPAAAARDLLVTERPPHGELPARVRS